MPSKTVTIGGKVLGVHHRQAEGGLLRMKNGIEAELALGRAKPNEIAERTVDLVHNYVGHNEGVTKEWLLGVLPADCQPLVRECIIASGGEVAEPGEAKSQQS